VAAYGGSSASTSRPAGAEVTTALAPVTLVLGGIRSGKSEYAEGLIDAAGGPATYIAPALARDAAMVERIRRHQARRGSLWTTVEEPLDVTGALLRSCACPVLVDSLSVWLANLMEAGRDVEAEGAALVAALGTLSGPAVLVADEVGLGGISANALQRRFADAAGLLNQMVATEADRVVLVAAGLPLILKDTRAGR